MESLSATLNAPAWPTTVQGWVALVARTRLPVLPSTLRVLASFGESEKDFDVHTLATALPRDPLFAVKLFAYLVRRRGASAAADVGTVDRAILMMGTAACLSAFADTPPLAPRAGTPVQAHRGLVRALRRSRRASDMAMSLAMWRNDRAADEIAMAALLHDVAEVLVWYLAPVAALEIERRQAGDPTLRSRVAQAQVLGFELGLLQQALARRWRLPDQIVAMMLGSPMAEGRAQLVALAVNTARHSAHGWANAALPDDYRGVATMLSISDEKARELLGAH